MTELDIMKRAKMYMDKLAQGIDPISGNEVPGDSVLNQARLSKCFLYVSGVLQQAIDNDGYVGRKPKKTKYELSPQLLTRVSPADRPLRISEFAAMLAEATENANIRRPKITSFINWLVEKGFLVKLRSENGKEHSVPTAAGKEIGIFEDTYQSRFGQYTEVFYSVEAQQFLLAL